ncbi:zinc finger and BTB domain-containing protein 40-like isoform X1, partial [Leptotrombidium deliense]
KVRCDYPDCKEIFNTIKQRDDHDRATHTIPGIAYPCENCDREFDTIGTLRDHFKNNHKEYPCELCKQQVTGRKNFKQHQKGCKTSLTPQVQAENVQLLPHACSYPNCYCSYLTKAKLDSHVLHRHEIHACKKCGKEFDGYDRYYSHQRTCGNKNKCEFPGCEETFHTVKERKDHFRRVHAEVSEYPCPHCVKVFKRQGKLETHITNIHTQQTCTACNLTFKGLNSLNKHNIDKHP